MPIWVPPPYGATASSCACAAARASLSASREPGKSTARGTRPATANCPTSPPSPPLEGEGGLTAPDCADSSPRVIGTPPLAGEGPGERSGMAFSRPTAAMSGSKDGVGIRLYPFANSIGTPALPGSQRHRTRLQHHFDAALRGGEDLTGVAEILRVEDTLEAGHDLQVGVGENRAHVVDL